jgi:hypothetical protein
MSLANYFLADLPPGATITPTMITEACQTLKRNRERFLAQRSTSHIVGAIAEIARAWLAPGNPFRRRALELGPAATGFSQATLASGLDGFFGSLTQESLHALVVQDLGHIERLDGLSASEHDRRAACAAMARGPDLLVHITGGVLPIPAFTSLVLGLLARSAQFLKCATGTALLPRLLAHSLYEAEPKLGACLEIVEWKGGTEALEAALFAEADCITAMGEDATLAAIRQRVPRHARFLGYGHRVSFGYVAKGAPAGLNRRGVAAEAAQDVVAWNQLGCLSPHLFYVEMGGSVSPMDFAEALADELSACERTHPRGPLPPDAAAAIATRRAFYEVRAAHSYDTRQWCSPGSTAWTVVFENDPKFQASCLNRFVYVKPVPDLEHALQGADAVRGRVSTVGLAAPEQRAGALAAELARWGVTRVCRVGQMQAPPLTWRHDGRPALGDLVTWTDWES